jgi:hypothetical protein
VRSPIVVSASIRRLVQCMGGETRTVVVDPGVELLREVKVGDQVVVRHTEAVALAVKVGS